ncbi:MAG: hypothetical protein IKA11_04555 [Clostridia bacterium]|nr:hypothetical protein [Clostridia bacterium]
MKKLLIFFVCFVFLTCFFGCDKGAEEGPPAPQFTQLQASDFSTSGNAEIVSVTDNSVLPIGVGLREPPKTESYIITFNGAGSGKVKLNKSKIKANEYLTFTYYYERTCTPSFLGIYLLRIKGVVERDGTAFGDYVMRHYDADGDFIAGIYSDSGTLNSNLKGNWLTLEIYFESAPAKDLEFGCVWIGNGSSANFYLTDVRVSEKSLMNIENN